MMGCRSPKLRGIWQLTNATAAADLPLAVNTSCTAQTHTSRHGLVWSLSGPVSAGIVLIWVSSLVV